MLVPPRPVLAISISGLSHFRIHCAALSTIPYTRLFNLAGYQRKLLLSLPLPMYSMPCHSLLLSIPCLALPLSKVKLLSYHRVLLHQKCPSSPSWPPLSLIPFPRTVLLGDKSRKRE